MKALEILRFLNMQRGTASSSDIRAAWHAADEGGTIQADRAARLFPHDARLHTCMSMQRAMEIMGARRNEGEE